MRFTFNFKELQLSSIKFDQISGKPVRIKKTMVKFVIFTEMSGKIVINKNTSGKVNLI